MTFHMEDKWYKLQNYRFKSSVFGVCILTFMNRSPTGLGEIQGVSDQILLPERMVPVFSF
jgi:hypothetical protein